MKTKLAASKLLLLVLLLGLAAMRSSHAATINWTNINGGSWSAAANWSPNQVPDVTDSAVINAAGTYTVTLDTSATLVSVTVGGSSGKQTLAQASATLTLSGASVINPNGIFEFSGGNLVSQAPLTVHGLFTWTGGIVQGALAVANDGSMNLQNTAELSGTLTNAGTIRLAAGRLFLENAGTINNQAGGTFEMQGDNEFLPFGASPNRFINQGTFRKSGSGSSSSIQVDFTNAGAVDAQSGTLTFPNGFTSRGNFNVAPAAIVSLAGGIFSFQTGHAFSGDGFYGVSIGDVTLIGNITAANFQVTGGTVRGTNLLTGTLHWSGGIFRGALTVATGGLLKLDSPGTVEYVGSLTNAGTIIWTAGRFYLEEATTFDNQAGATFEIQVDSELLPFGAAPNRFINHGLFRKSAGTGISSIETDFINTGTVDVQSGGVNFPKGFASSGHFNVAPGASLNLVGGIFSFESGHSFSGAGFYGIPLGDITLIGDITGTNFQVVAGIVRGTNRLTGTLHWSGGFIRGNLSVVPGGVLNMDSPGAVEYSGTITNNGTINWIAGRFFLEEASTLDNQAGATFEIQVDSELLPFGAAPNRFINHGLFRKSAGAGLTSIQVEFTNAGAVEANTGTLGFAGGFTQTAGSTLLNGGNLSSSQPVQIQGGTLAGSGDIAATVINGAQVSPGASPGRLNIIGDYSQSAAGALNIELAGLTPDAFDQLAVSGTVALDGLLSTALIKGFAPAANSTFAFLTAGALNGQFARHTYPSNQVELQIDYAANSAALRVLQVFTNVSKFPPVLAAIPDQTVNELALLSLTATATDADVPANILTFRLDAAPAGAAIDPNTGAFTWRPTEAQGPGKYPVTVRVTDNGSLFDTKTFNVTVKEVNQAPVLPAIAPQLIGPGRTLKFTATASDADLPPQALTFSLDPGAPAGAFINSGTGEFTWAVPASQPAGRINVVVRVTDNAESPASASQTVVIEVDRDGPRVTAMTPSGAISTVLDHVDVTFNKPIDPATLDSSDISLTGPKGPIPTSVQAVSERVYRIAFASLAPGNYTLKVGPNVGDLAGNLMNQDGDATNGEPVQDVFTGSLSIGLADLLVTAITAPAQALVGQPFPVVWTVTNQGNATAFGPWADSIELVDKSPGGVVQALAFVTLTDPLLAGQSITHTQSVILPAGVFGQRFVALRADVFDQVAEGANETNNVTEDDQPIQILAPDLIVTSVNVPASAQFGQTLNVTWSVKNNGTGQALGSWSDSLYLTSDANSLAGATLLLTQPIAAAPLAAGGSYTQTQPVTLPLNTGLAPGNYFVLVVADDSSAQPESNEENNSGSKAVALASPPLPDLVVRNILAPPNAQPGQQAELRWTIANQGNLQAVGPWSETVSLSNQPPIETFIYTNTLPAGASLVRTQSVTVPLNGAAGALRFVVEADSGLEIAESNETNNLAVAAASTTVPAVLTLMVPLDQIAENAPDPVIHAEVTRNGSRDNPLTVSLTTSKGTELTLPASVIIPAGQVTAGFDLTVHRDGVVDGPQLVTISAGATGFTGATARITVLDADLPRLTVSFAQTNLVEGTNVTATVRRDGPTANALTVSLESSDPAQLSVPATVTIPANQASAPFLVQAEDDTLVEANHDYSVSASAPGFISGSATVEVSDDDIPELTVRLAAHEVSEGSGALATTGTVSRDRVGPRALVVALESSNVNAAQVPSTVTIPAGALSASFTVAAVNNDLLDGKKTAFIRAYATDSLTGERLRPGTPDTLSVLDDEGPTLRIEIARGLVPEGLNPATTATVTRNSANSLPLVVSLASSVTSEATVPATVTIPAGQSSATFPIASLQDGVSDGDKTVTITASAAGFTSGTASLVVTDRDLPDLVVDSITVPANGATESSFEVSFRVANQGLAAAAGATLQRVYLSSDPVIGDDTLLGQAEFPGPLPAGAHFDQTLSLRLPRTTGDYWIVVTTDSNDSNAETLENNNAAITRQPVHVEKTYSATVQTDVQVALAGTPVPLRGQATLTANGKPAPFSLVNIHLEVRGTKRIISVLTDADGRFATVFQPLPGEAGSYKVGADHPGVSETAVQDTFTLLGLRVTPPSGVLKAIEGGRLTGSAKVENLSDLELKGLTAVVVQKPANLQVSLTLSNNLPGLAETSLDFAITPTDTSITQGIVLIRLSNPEGVSADLQLPVVIEFLRPRLVADPASLVAGMKRGDQTTVQFQLSNTGGAASGALDILPPAVPWLMVASGGHAASLDPGATNTITLVLTPPEDLPLGDHQGTIVISSPATSVSVPFNFRALSTASGDLKVTSVDEYTYYADGSPKVTNATVTVTDAVSGNVVASGLTDPGGELVITNLAEAYYRIDVRADGHASFHSTSLLAAGKTNEVLAFLNRETVKYIWKVVPTEIEDRTKIVIETVFETVVPFPVVTVEPMVIDLADIQGDEAQIDLKITNHGLVAANDTRIQFGTHPNFSATPLVSNIGVLRAKSSITVPLVIKRLKPASVGTQSASRPGRAGASSGAACDMSGATLFNAICGPVRRDYSVPILLQNASSGCSGGDAAGFGGAGFADLFGGGGGTGFEGGGGSGGGAYVAPVFVNDAAPCNLCPLQTLGAAAGCVVPLAGDIFANPSTKFGKDAILTAVDKIGAIKSVGEVLGSGGRGGGRAGGPTGGGGGDFGAGLEGATTLLEAAETFGIEAGKNILTPLKILSCGYNIATACNPKTSALARESVREGGLPRTLSVGDVSRPELAPLNKYLERLQKLVDVDLLLFGDEVWLLDESGQGPKWLAAFLDRVKTTSGEGVKISATERAELLAMALPSTVTAADANKFLDRWNRTMTYWAAGRFSRADVPAGESTDFLALDTFRSAVAAANEAIRQTEAEGFASVSAAVENARQDLVRFLTEPGASAGGEGGCATVRLRIEQQAVITRDAFDASLEIANSTGGPLENVSVDLQVRTEKGEETTSLFGIRPPVLSGLSAVDGTGVIGANVTGKASWIIIPTSEAAPTGPTVMLVSGTLKYRQEGVVVTIPLLPASITVLPNASLKVKYFHQRDVFADDPFTPETEPSIPFSLGVLIQNNGHGAARNVRLTSAQPKIVENEKGLLIDFEIIATEVAGQSLSPSLTANFGDIGPGEVAVGRWLLRSSLQGLFIDYKASFEHLDGLGDPRLSLIDSVEIHELNHLVRADGPFEDGKPDFLVNDVPDLEDMPDTLYLSDGRIEPVTLVTQAAVDAPPGAGDLEVRLTASMPAGWAYLRIPDPANGQFRLAHVRRANGSELLLDYNVWTTDRTFIGNGRRPIRENILHLLDFNSAGSYTLVYEQPPPEDSAAPTSTVEGLPVNSSAQIPVRWSGQDGAGSGIDFFDVFVSINGGPFSPWLQKTTLTGAIYDGKQGERYAFYSVATDHAGNQEAPHTTPDTQTAVNLVNTAPKLTLPSSVTIKEGETLSVSATASDLDLPANTLTFSLDPSAPSGAVIDTATGLLTWVTGEGNGPSTNLITVRVSDNGVPALSATSVVTVIVSEVNQAPDLEPIADRVINEGAKLAFAPAAADPDLPANHLAFRLGAGAPVGAAITPAGLFTWTPTALQGPSTNPVTIIVSDDGSPSLSATQKFIVVVRDVLGDVALSMGGTQLQTGQKGSVPIQLASAVDLTNLEFTLELSEPGLTNLTLKPLVPEIGFASLHPLAPNRLKIQLSTAAGTILQGNQSVAQLNFDTDVAGNSALVRLQISQIEGRLATGAPLTKVTSQSGRVIIIGRQPVLEAGLFPTPALILYGRPGATFGIEYKTNLVAGVPWTQLVRVTQTNLSQTIDGLVTGQAMIFYRAFEP